MKLIIKSVLTVLCIAYIFGAFIYYDFLWLERIQTWDPFSRFIFVFILVVGSIFAGAFYEIYRGGDNK